MKENLKQQSEWDNGYETTEIAMAPKTHPISKLIYKYFSNQKESVFEVGCFPGSFLSIFGELGHKINGVDKTSRLNELLTFFSKRKYDVGTISDTDFFEISNNDKYGIVCSFGFIEHFTNYREVIKKHLYLVEDSGYVFITTPNFKGLFHHICHFLVDSENLSKHNLTSMNPKEWSEICREKGFDIIYSGWIGKFDFWYEKQNRNFFQKIALFVIRSISFILKRVIWFESKTFSPFCVIIAKKNENPTN